MKLSQEGSTYYSSIRDTSSASGASYSYQPPVLTSDDKVCLFKVRLFECL